MRDGTIFKPRWMSFVDYFSRFHKVYRLHEFTAVECGRYLLEFWSLMGGAMVNLVRDNEPGFMGQMERWLTRYDVTQCPTAKDSPHQNPVAENHGGYLKAIFFRSWDELLRLDEFSGVSPEEVMSACEIAKNSFPSRCGMPPYRVAFGRDPTFLTSSFEEDRVKMEDPRQFGEYVHVRETIHKIAQRHVLAVASSRAIKDAILKRSFRSDGHFQFEVGQHIEFWEYGPTKAESGWIGRGIVTAVRGKVLSVNRTNGRQAEIDAAFARLYIPPVAPSGVERVRADDSDDVRVESDDIEEMIHDRLENFEDSENARNRVRRRQVQYESQPMVWKTIRLLFSQKGPGKSFASSGMVTLGCYRLANGKLSKVSDSNATRRKNYSDSYEVLSKVFMRSIEGRMDLGEPHQIRVHKVAANVPIRRNHVARCFVLEMCQNKPFCWSDWPADLGNVWVSELEGCEVIVTFSWFDADEYSAMIRESIVQYSEWLPDNIAEDSVKFEALLSENQDPNARSKRIDSALCRLVGDVDAFSVINRKRKLQVNRTPSYLCCDESLVPEYPYPESPQEFTAFEAYCLGECGDVGPDRLEKWCGGKDGYEHVFYVSGTIDEIDEMVSYYVSDVVQGDIEIQCQMEESFVTMREMKAKETPQRLAVGEMWDLSMQRELCSWRDHECVRVVDAKEMERDKIRPITTRWVFTRKEGKTGPESFKSRLVARGFQDQTVGDDVGSPTAGRDSFRIQLALAANFSWDMDVADVPTAFLRADKQLFKRKVYLKPPCVGMKMCPPEIRPEKNQVWRCITPVYGLNDAPRLWYETAVAKFLGEGLSRCAWDPCVFYRRGVNGKGLSGILILHVDDTSACGEPAFLKFCSTLLSSMGVKKFKRVGSEPIRYCGIEIQREKDGSLIAQQYKYHEMVGLIDTPKARLNDMKVTDKEVSEARSVLGALAWLSTQTRPDLAIVVSELVGWLAEAQEPKVSLLRKINAVVKMVKAKPFAIVFHAHKIPMENLSVSVFQDSSWASMPGLRSQEGIVCVLTDNRIAEKCVDLAGSPNVQIRGTATSKERPPVSLLSWKSSRVKRVVRSTFAAETMALADGMDKGLAVFGLLSELLACPVQHPVVLFEDCMSVVSNCTATCPHQLEKRLTLDLASIREAIEDRKVLLRWIPTEEQLADPLTKWGAKLVLRMKDWLTNGWTEISCEGKVRISRIMSPSGRGPRNWFGILSECGDITGESVLIHAQSMFMIDPDSVRCWL